MISSILSIIEFLITPKLHSSLKGEHNIILIQSIRSTSLAITTVSRIKSILPGPGKGCLICIDHHPLGSMVYTKPVYYIGVPYHSHYIKTSVKIEQVIFFFYGLKD